MAEKKTSEKGKKNSKKNEEKNVRIKRPRPKEKPAPAEKPQKSESEIIAIKQGRSLIMFVSAVLLTSIIFIPGDMVWLWLHNAVRGTFSMFSLYWAALLVALAVFDILNKEYPKLVFKASFASGLVVALNALVYIYTYDGTSGIKKAFADGIAYDGGGALGFLLGYPFIKLFGIIPAKILIVMAVIVLIVFAAGIPIKKLYTAAFHKVCDWFKTLASRIKKLITERSPKMITEDNYFDDDDYDTFSIDDDEQNDDDDTMPQSPVMSEDLFNDDDEFFFDEEDDEKNVVEEQEQEDDEPFVTDLREEEEEEQYVDNDVPRPEPDEDEILRGILGEDFFDVTEPDQNSGAADAAKEINQSKSSSFPRSDEPPEVEKKVPKKKNGKKKYIFPPVDLLTESKTANVNYEQELRENAEKLIQALESFQVGAKIINYCRGPSVTRYEIQPAPGVKISKITGLSDDIALNLAANGGVRMEAPIPGKPAIGVEIPNKKVTQVTMRELFESPEFAKHKKTKKLECVLGKDVAGKIIMMDLASMPHLLIAGTTGSGKSVCVNSILMSILLRATPDEVKMILIDPKLVEFSKYKGIPHLLVPVVSDVKKAAGALGWAVSEMEDRYKELSLYDVKDIDSYNRLVDKNLAEMTQEEIDNPGEGETINGVYKPPRAVKKMPKIVIAIDELADLMMAAPGEVEDYICRLAQKARAAGMHLVIATQRPSVNVITGVIKANIPSRISLKVASYVDSKTILDQGGGEKLIGKGDMLYNPVGAPKPMRVQGGFSSDEDIGAVTDFIKKHSSSDYDSSITEEIERISESVGVKGGSKDSGKDLDGEDFADSDPLLEDAINYVVEAGQASASMLQRRMRIGYSRAGRLIDIMENMGIVGPHEGSKSRKVLISKQDWIERKISNAAEA